jgi:hypothetical protein
MGHGPHSSTLVCICVVRSLFVLFYLVFVCKCVLSAGDNPIAVNKYIISINWPVRLTTHFCLESILRMNGVVPPLLCTFVACVQESLPQHLA